MTNKVEISSKIKNFKRRDNKLIVELDSSITQAPLLDNNFKDFTTNDDQLTESLEYIYQAINSIYSMFLDFVSKTLTEELATLDDDILENIMQNEENVFYISCDNDDVVDYIFNDNLDLDKLKPYIELVVEIFKSSLDITHLLKNTFLGLISAKKGSVDLEKFLKDTTDKLVGKGDE